MKGGTPAKENKNIVKNSKYELSKLNVFNEYIVFKVELQYDKSNQKNQSMLNYIKTYKKK